MRSEPGLIDGLPDPDDDLLTPREVAEMCAVSVGTVAKWARAGILQVAFRTKGGHRRFRRADVEAFKTACLPKVKALEMDIVRRYDQSRDVHQVAAEVGLSYLTTYRIVRMHRPAPPEHDPGDDLLTLTEVAEITGRTAITVSRWARSGKLPFTTTAGGRRRFRRADAEALDQVDVDPERRQLEADAVRLYEQGRSIRQVAVTFNCGYGVMRRILLRHNALRRTNDPAVGLVLTRSPAASGDQEVLGVAGAIPGERNR